MAAWCCVLKRKGAGKRRRLFPCFLHCFRSRSFACRVQTAKVPQSRMSHTHSRHSIFHLSMLPPVLRPPALRCFPFKLPRCLVHQVTRPPFPVLDTGLYCPLFIAQHYVPGFLTCFVHVCHKLTCMNPFSETFSHSHPILPHFSTICPQPRNCCIFIYSPLTQT